MRIKFGSAALVFALAAVLTGCGGGGDTLELGGGSGHGAHSAAFFSV